MEMGYEHLLHAAILKVVPDGVEGAEDDALHVLEIQFERQGIEQAVDAVQRLLDLFDKENDILFGQQMEPRSCDGRDTGEVASDKDALRMTDAVIGVGGYLILRQCAEENVTGDARGRFLTACDLEGHGTVDAHHIGAGNGIEQDDDIAVADDPLGVLLELFGRNTAQQMDGSVTAARTDDSLYRVIFERP